MENDLLKAAQDSGYSKVFDDSNPVVIGPYVCDISNDLKHIKGPSDLRPKFHGDANQYTEQIGYLCAGFVTPEVVTTIDTLRKGIYNQILLPVNDSATGYYYYQLWQRSSEKERAFDDIDLLIDEAKIVLGECVNGDYAKSKCDDCSSIFAELCQEKYGIGDAKKMHFRLDPNREYSEHTVVLIDDTVIDWTARQFASLRGTTFPFIYKVREYNPWLRGTPMVIEGDDQMEIIE